MHKFIEQYTQGPEVNPIIIRVVKQHLWRHILIGSTKSSSWSMDILGAPSKITQLDIQMSIEQ